MIGYSCIGRYFDKLGCYLTLGGLIQDHNLEIIYPGGHIQCFFEFDESEVDQNE